MDGKWKGQHRIRKRPLGLSSYKTIYMELQKEIIFQRKKQ